MTDVALATTEAPDAVAVNAEIVSGIYFAVTEPSDGVVLHVRNPSVVLAASEAVDTAAISAQITGTMSMLAQEAADGVSLPIIVLWTSASDPNDPSIWVTVNDGMPYNQAVN